MLPAYIMVVDVKTERNRISCEQFREEVSSCLACLDALKGAFDSSPSTLVYFHEQPDANDESEFLEARGVVMISLGKKRSEYLIELYKSVARLIYLELPEYYQLSISIEGMKFS